MPFAAVLTRGQSTFLSPPVAVLCTEGHIWARSMSSCYGILPIYKPPTHSVKESRFSLRALAACASPRYPLSFAMRVDCSIGTTLAPARASIIVEMLPGSARMARSHDSTSPGKNAIDSRTVPGRRCLPTRSWHTTRREKRRRHSRRSCPSWTRRIPLPRKRPGEKAPLPGSPIDR